MSTSARPVRVLLADDQELVRAGFRAILEASGIDVVGEAADGAEAVALTREHRPDVVLLDIRMPFVDGLTAARAILNRPEPPGVLMLTTFDHDDYVIEALRNGANGFLLKDLPRDQLVSAVIAVAEGRDWFSPSILRRLMAAYGAAATSAAPAGPPRVDGSPLSRLSAREMDVLRAAARGLTNLEIAEELYLTEATVKTYVSRMLEKLGVRRRLEAVLLAHEYGIVETGVTPDRARPGLSGS